MKKKEFDVPRLDKDDKLISRFYEKIMLDQEVRAFIDEHQLPRDFVVDNLGVFMRLVDENEPCRACPGYLNCPKEPRGYNTALNFGQADLEVIYRRCQPFLEYQLIHKNYLIRDFPEEWLTKRLNDVTRNPKRVQILFKFAEIVAEKMSKNYFIYNEKPVGKSFIAASLCNEVVFQNNESVAFVNTRVLFERARDTIYNDKAAYEDLLNKVFSASVLVLDDFGTEKVTDLSVEILSQIIEERLRLNLTTIILSQYTVEEIKTTLYKFQELKARRLFSHLVNKFEEIYLEGI